MPAPSELPTWATAGSAEITEPTDPIKAQGFVDGYPAAHEWVNWFWNSVSEWLGWIAGGGQGTYSDPETAYAEMDAGETAWVFEVEDGYQGAEHTTPAAPTAVVQDMDVDGVYLYYCLTTAGYRRARTLPSTLAATYTPTNAGTVVAIASDGRSVALAYGNYVECFEPTGASRWAYNHSAAVQDVAFAPNGDVLFVGTSALANSWTNLNRLGRVTGTSTGPGWVKDFYTGVAGTLYSVCSAGGRVIAAGGVNGGGDNIVVYDEGTGAELRTGTTGADVSEPGCLASDGVMVFVALSADPYLEVYGLLYLDAVSTRSDIAIHCHAVAVDQDHVYLALEETGSGDGYVQAITKDTFTPIYQTDTLTADYPTAVASDGSGLFYGQTADAGGTLHRVYRGRNRAELWRRTDPTDGAVTPWTRAIYPIRER